MKKSILLLSLLSAGLVLASCGNSSSSSSTPTTSDPSTGTSTTETSTTDPVVHVESVDITETSLELKEGASSDPLTVTVLPENATDKTYTFSVGDASIATVSENGVVTALKEGTTYVAVTTTDGNHTDRVDVNVYHEYEVTTAEVAGVTITTSVSSAKVGTKVDVTLTYDKTALTVGAVTTVGAENTITLGTSGDAYYFYMPNYDVEINVATSPILTKYAVKNGNTAAVLDTVGAYAAGETVNIPFTLKPGYNFEGCTVATDPFDPADAVTIESSVADGVITFVMPSENVVVSVLTSAATFAIAKNDTYSHINSIKANDKTVSIANGSYYVNYGAAVSVVFYSSTSSSTEKYHPVSVTIPELDVTIPVEGEKVQFAMPHFDITLNINTEATLRNVSFVGSEHLTPVLYEKVDGAYVATATNAGIFDNTYYVKVNSTNIEQYQVNTIEGSYIPQGSSYSSTLALTLNADGYYEFTMPKVDLPKILTITVTEKDMTLFAGQSFVGTYVGLNSFNSNTKTSWTSSYGFTIDSAGIVNKNGTLTSFTSFDANTGLLSNSDKTKAAMVAGNFVFAHHSFDSSTPIGSDIVIGYKLQEGDTSTTYTVNNYSFAGKYHVITVFKEGVLVSSLFLDVAKQLVFLNPTLEFTAGTYVSDSTATYTVAKDGVLFYSVTNKSTIVSYDGLQGTYTCDGSSDIVVDGLGSLTFEGKTLKYTAEGRQITTKYMVDDATMETLVVTLGKDGTYTIDSRTTSAYVSPLVSGRYFTGLSKNSYHCQIYFSDDEHAIIWITYDESKTTAPSSASYGYDANATYTFDAGTMTVTVSSTYGEIVAVLSGDAGSYQLKVSDDSSFTSYYSGNLQGKTLTEYTVA